MTPVRAVVFDGDDTLWRTERLYDRARAAARRVVEEAGLDGGEWEALERRIDVANVARLGHSRDRFPTSCVEAYESVVEAAGRTPDANVQKAVWNAAAAAFDERARLIPHAKRTLAELRRRGLRLALLTKGDEALQRRRVQDSGLGAFFDVVEIVDEKTPDAIRRVLERLGAPAEAAISVGNSLRSDVLPSLEANVQPVWIDAHVWEYERAPPGVVDDRVVRLKDLSSLLDLETS